MEAAHIRIRMPSVGHVATGEHPTSCRAHIHTARAFSWCCGDGWACDGCRQAGVPPDSVNRIGATALHIAAYAGKGLEVRSTSSTPLPPPSHPPRPRQ